MAHTEHFKFNNIPNPIIEEHKAWVKENPRLARLEPEQLDNVNIEVFSHRHHKETANELHEALVNSGFLAKHPLFSIKIETM